MTADHGSTAGDRPAPTEAARTLTRPTGHLHRGLLVLAFVASASAAVWLSFAVVALLSPEWRYPWWLIAAAFAAFWMSMFVGSTALWAAASQRPARKPAAVAATGATAALLLLWLIV